jgi:opacity protein-like surface antigen
MKKVLMSLLVCLMVYSFTATSALSEEGMYVSGNVGYAMLSDSDGSFDGDTGNASFDDGYVGTLALGYGLSDKFRVEGEIGYQKNDFNKGTNSEGTEDLSDFDVSSTSFLVNGYYDFANKSSFTPFLTAGAGVANVEVSGFGADVDDTVFAYQLGAGVGYAVTTNTNLDLKYRYFATEDVEHAGAEAEYASHNIYLGLRYNF